MTGFCIKCKRKTEQIEGHIIYYKNGTPVEQGKCSVCGSKMNRMLSKAEREALKEKQLGGIQQTPATS
jgi:hypothetical protein